MDELIAALKKLLGEGKKAEIVTALNEHAHDVYQTVFDKGHSAATADGKKTKADAEREKKELQEKLEAAEKRAEEAEKKAPDVATVRAEHQKQIKDLQEKHKTELETERTARMQERRGRDVETFRAQLIAAGLNPDYAEVQAEKQSKRFRYTEAGVLEVLQDGKDIPFAPGEKQTAIGLLVEEVKKAAPPIFVTAKGEEGGGIGGSGHGGSAGGSYDPVKAGKALAEEQKKSADKESLALR